MTTPVLTLFNNKGGVGKTSLVYHLAWMMSQLGKRVLVVDLDPQANLTAAFLDEDYLANLWEEANQPASTQNYTIYQCVAPLTQVGDIRPPRLLSFGPNLFLLPGALDLSGFEDFLSSEWSNAMGSANLFRPFRVLTAFWQVAQMGASNVKADLIIVDVGPNLGAINRSALIASDFVLVPLGADLFSIQGLRNLGPTLRRWTEDWRKRLDNWPDRKFALPTGQMKPIGYVVQQHSVRLTRPVKAYNRWMDRIPNEYRESVLNEPPIFGLRPVDDIYCVAMLKHYRSLVAMAQEKRKPIFQLTSADGAIGAHAKAVQEAAHDFRVLTDKVLLNIESVQFGLI